MGQRFNLIGNKCFELQNSETYIQTLNSVTVQTLEKASRAWVECVCVYTLQFGQQRKKSQHFKAATYCYLNCHRHFSNLISSVGNYWMHDSERLFSIRFSPLKKTDTEFETHFQRFLVGFHRSDVFFWVLLIIPFSIDKNGTPNKGFLFLILCSRIGWRFSLCLCDQSRLFTGVNESCIR